jgi:hypothetical protein
METPDNAAPQPFFLVVDESSGEIYCAHQEYLAADRTLRTRLTDSDRVIDIALRANPEARSRKDRLTVVPVVCSPATNFSRFTVDIATARLRERHVPEVEIPTNAVQRPGAEHGA